MTSAFHLEGRRAIVTGAAGGIGRAVSEALAARGCHLIITDIDEKGLANTALQARNVDVRRQRLDVADEASINAFARAVDAEGLEVDILVNNAGVALGGTFEQLAPEQFEWLFAINFWGIVRMTRAFLPALRRSQDARLVNMSSLFGIIAPPGQCAYSASKFAVRGFSESLRKELAGTNVGVTVAHPGGVATRIASSARNAEGLAAGEAAEIQEKFQQLLRLSPEQAAEEIVRAVERRRERVLVGRDAKLASVVERLMPVSYWKLIGRRV